MKRLLLLPVLMFGLSFACDQPYEEVRNYKIGCPLEEHSKLRLESNERGVKRYHLYSSDDFYIMQDVDVVNGNIVNVRLTSGFNNNLDKNEFLKKISDRWGLNLKELTFEIGGISGKLKPSKSDIIKEIDIFLLLKDEKIIEFVELSYKSQAWFDYMEFGNNKDGIDSI